MNFRVPVFLCVPLRQEVERAVSSCVCSLSFFLALDFASEIVVLEFGKRSIKWRTGPMDFLCAFSWVEKSLLLSGNGMRRKGSVCLWFLAFSLLREKAYDIFPWGCSDHKFCDIFIMFFSTGCAHNHLAAQPVKHWPIAGSRSQTVNHHKMTSVLF